MKTILAALLLALSLNASANFVSLSKLNDALTSTEQTNQAAGIGYIAGVIDAYRGVAHCAPKELTLPQAVELTKMQINANKSRENEPADVIIVELFIKYWPCTKGKSV